MYRIKIYILYYVKLKYSFTNMLLILYVIGKYMLYSLSDTMHHF